MVLEINIVRNRGPKSQNGLGERFPHKHHRHRVTDHPHHPSDPTRKKIMKLRNGITFTEEIQENNEITVVEFEIPISDLDLYNSINQHINN